MEGFKEKPIVKVIIVRGENGDKTKLSELQNDMTFLTEQQIITLVTNIVQTGQVGDIDTGFVTKIKEQNHGRALQFWIGTQAEYNAIAEPTANMFYIVTDDPYKQEVQAALNAINTRIDDIDFPGVEAELSAMQTNITNFESDVAQAMTDLRGDVTREIEAYGDSIPTYGVTPSGSYEQIEVDTTGYIAGGSMRKIYFVVPLAKVLPNDKRAVLSSIQVTILYLNQYNSRTAVIGSDVSRATVENLGTALGITYTHSADLFTTSTPPTVGVHAEISFYVQNIE